MDARILIVAGAILLSGSLFAQENIALGKPVFEEGASFGWPTPPPGVLPEVVTDGVFLPPGDDWFNGSWWLDSECSFIPPHPDGEPPPPPEPCALRIELGEEFQIHSLVFQGDANDNYAVEFWDHQAGGWQPIWLFPVVDGQDDLQTRPEQLLDPPIVTSGLRIVGVDGDGRYAVSELQAFGERFDPCIAGGGSPVYANCWREAPVHEARVAAGDFCYRIEFSCDGFVNAGIGACLNPDGSIGFGMGAQIGDPHEPEPFEPNCGAGAGFMLNDKIEFSCSLDGQGKVKLRIKQVGMGYCD